MTDPTDETPSEPWDQSYAWCYYDAEYQQDGIVGPFKTLREAMDHAAQEEVEDARFLSLRQPKTPNAPTGFDAQVAVSPEAVDEVLADTPAPVEPRHRAAAQILVAEHEREVRNLRPIMSKSTAQALADAEQEGRRLERAAIMRLVHRTLARLAREQGADEPVFVETPKDGIQEMLVAITYGDHLQETHDQDTE